jgi:hypothetical protein
LPLIVAVLAAGVAHVPDPPAERPHLFQDLRPHRRRDAELVAFWIAHDDPAMVRTAKLVLSGEGRNGIAATIWASRTTIAPRAGVVTANLHV